MEPDNRIESSRVHVLQLFEARQRLMRSDGGGDGKRLTAGVITGVNVLICCDNGFTVLLGFYYFPFVSRSFSVLHRQYVFFCSLRFTVLRFCGIAIYGILWRYLPGTK